MQYFTAKIKIENVNLETDPDFEKYLREGLAARSHLSNISVTESPEKLGTFYCEFTLEAATKERAEKSALEDEVFEVIHATCKTIEGIKTTIVE